MANAKLLTNSWVLLHVRVKHDPWFHTEMSASRASSHNAEVALAVFYKTFPEQPTLISQTVHVGLGFGKQQH